MNPLVLEVVLDRLARELVNGGRIDVGRNPEDPEVGVQRTAEEAALPRGESAPAIGAAGRRATLRSRSRVAGLGLERRRDLPIDENARQDDRQPPCARSSG